MKRYLICSASALFLIILILFCNFSIPVILKSDRKDFIKYVEFNPTEIVLRQALKIDIETYKTDRHIGWVDLLAYSAAKTGGKFSKSKSKYVDELAKKIQEGEKLRDITKDLKYFSYYKKAYGAVLNGFVGQYKDENGQKQYGLKVYSPIAKGYHYSHYEDFGAARSYGYKRMHLGNDLLGNLGTPIVAIEDGVVECLGWNQYGGWRIGIRSFDKQRYYYYAHLRKNHPYHLNLKEGQKVKAGDVIGYLGMTGYSAKENVNNITTPHLHFGLQLIFDESQKECVNEIWVDVYSIINLLSDRKSEVVKDEKTKDYNKKA